MMKLKFISALIGAATLISCGPQYVKPVEASEVGFAVEFFKNVNAVEPGTSNVVVSPYSAAVAFSMLAEGAQGQTRVELDNALGGVLYKASDLGSNDTVVVKSANSLWLDDNFSPRNRYVNLLEKEFDAFVDVENFASPVAVKAINNWCSEHTNGKIPEIIKELSPGNLMVLINALYFNAPWENEFNPYMTMKQPFYGLSKESQVDMMGVKGSYKYAEYQGFQMIRLPYKGQTYSMYVILPPADMDINKIISNMDASVYRAALDKLSMQEVRFFMPRFKLETSMVLNKTLQQMGVKSAFSQAADFGGIAEMGQLSVGLVQQKCFIEVTEKGTEAAAVTSIMIRGTSVRPPKVLPIMRVDRPFVFVIADENNQNILFAGKIVNL